MNSVSKVFAILISIFLFLLYPLYQQTQRQDDIAQIVVHKAVTEFVDAARTKGYISPEMYSEFSRKLSATGNLFDIEITHKHKKYNPLYSDPADPSTFQQTFDDYYDGHYTEEIMKVLFPDNNLPIDSDERIYKLNVFDFISVKVTNRNRTMAQVIQSGLFGIGGQSAARLFVPYGGMVLNEDY